MHGDICGPITPATPSGNRYFLLLVDDFSRFMWVSLLPSKDAATTAIKRIQAAAERKTGKKMVTLRTDRGGEFAAMDFVDYCAQLGVRRQLTAPYTPQQNGVVERRNQSVVGTARSMMKAKDLPGMFWGEAVSTAVYLLNRSSSKAIGGKTPYQLWNGVTPAVEHLRTFGCIAHVKVNTPHLKKLDDRSRRMVFVGYEPGSKAYRVYDPTTRRLHISRDVVFEEAAQWAWGPGDDVGTGDFVVEEPESTEPSLVTTTRTVALHAPPSAPTSSTSPSSASPAPTGVHPTPTPSWTPAGSQAASGPSSSPSYVEFASPPEAEHDDYLDADHDEDAPLWFRRIDNVLGEAPTPGLAPRDLEERLLLASDAEPASLDEAMRHECWRLSMLDEMTSIEASGTWTLVDAPARIRPIGLKWVFKAKKDASGIVTKHKARLVAKGYV